MAVNNRESPAYSSDTERLLLEELQAFYKSVVSPAKHLIKEDFRKISELALNENDQEL